MAGAEQYFKYFKTLFLTSYMYVGLVVGIVLMIILYMWVINPGVARCVKDYPDNCTDKPNLIPAGQACTTGTQDTCRGGYTCAPNLGEPLDGGNGTCKKD